MLSVYLYGRSDKLKLNRKDAAPFAKATARQEGREEK
mgnify:CR=1 FL=1